MPSRSQPLADYLAGLPPVTTSITLTFAEIEAVLGEELPAAAAMRPWWVDLTRARASLRVGQERVTFARTDSTPSPTA